MSLMSHPATLLMSDPHRTGHEPKTLGETNMIDALEYVKIRLAAISKSDRGASAVEYGLLVALIAIIIIVAVSLLGNNLSTIFNDTASSID